MNEVLNYCLKNKEFALLLKNILELKKAIYFKENEINEKLKKLLLRKDSTLYDYFERGFNAGSCGYTSMLLSFLFEDCYYISGINKYLAGSKNSPKGEHTWLIANGKLYDSSLEIIFSDNSLGYEEITRISKKELLASPNYYILNNYVKSGIPIFDYPRLLDKLIDYIDDTTTSKLFFSKFCL